MTRLICVIAIEIGGISARQDPRGPAVRDLTVPQNGVPLDDSQLLIKHTLSNASSQNLSHCQ